MDKIKSYKSIKFDYYNSDDMGVWVGICEECETKHKGNLKGEYIGGQAGICGVYGCSNSSWDSDIMVNYLEFAKWED